MFNVKVIYFFPLLNKLSKTKKMQKTVLKLVHRSDVIEKH